MDAGSQESLIFCWMPLFLAFARPRRLGSGESSALRTQCDVHRESLLLSYRHSETATTGWRP